MQRIDGRCAVVALLAGSTRSTRVIPGLQSFVLHICMSWRGVFMDIRSVRRVVAGAMIGTAVTGVAMTSLSPAACADTKLPAHGVPGTKYERSFIAIKPDGVQRGLIGKIIQRFEEKGYKLVAMKMIHPTKKMAENHYGELQPRAMPTRATALHCHCSCSLTCSQNKHALPR